MKRFYIIGLSSWSTCCCAFILIRKFKKFAVHAETSSRAGKNYGFGLYAANSQADRAKKGFHYYDNADKNPAPAFTAVERILRDYFPDSGTNMKIALVFMTLNEAKYKSILDTLNDQADMTSASPRPFSLSFYFSNVYSL